MCMRHLLLLPLVLAFAVGTAAAPSAQDGVPGYWVRIEAGTFPMGASRESDSIASFDEAPEHKVTLAAFDIGRREVTVRRFAAFVKAGGYSDEAMRPLWDLVEFGEANRFGAWDSPLDWDGQAQHPDRPVTGVSWYEAMAYCRWLSLQTDEKITLPTEAQWERAARGTEGRRFPWGSQIPDGTLQLNIDGHIGHAADVGTHPDGDTPGTQPISDLAGNAWEWCLDRKVSYGVEPRAGDGLRDGRSGYRAVRGGSFMHSGKDLRAACRSGAGPTVRTEVLGFRLVRMAVE